MLTPTLSIVPPGGFHFVDTTGPVEVRTDGYSYDDVAQKVLKNRLANGRPPGNPSQEVVDYVCGNWPQFCSESRVISDPDVGSTTGQYQGLASRCATWIAAFFQTYRADPGVPLSVSQQRADTCCACPRNQEFRGGCGSCVENINRLFFVWRRDRALPRESELGGCTVIGQHNGCAALAARLPDLSPEIQAALPSDCWRK